MALIIQPFPNTILWHCYPLKMENILPQGIGLSINLIIVKNPSKYEVTIDELEANTDIDFFPNLPSDIEKDVEKSKDNWKW